jgi:hypothetical protein
VGSPFKAADMRAVIDRARANTSLAVIVAFFMMQIGWLAMAAIVIGLCYAVLAVTGTADAFNERHMLLAWMLGAGTGGFVAAYVTPKIFKDVRPASIANGLILVAVTLFVLAMLPVVFDRYYGPLFATVYFAHALALVIGAKIGQTLCTSPA